jgi:hypothetical protein
MEDVKRSMAAVWIGNRRRGRRRQRPTFYQGSRWRRGGRDGQRCSPRGQAIKNDILGGDAIGRVWRREWNGHGAVEALDPAAAMDIICEWVVACVREVGGFLLSLFFFARHCL